MSYPLRTCTQCNQSYWTGFRAGETGKCPNCTDQAAVAAINESRPDEYGRRFATLSSLPPRMRLPPRRTAPEVSYSEPPQLLVLPRQLSQQQQPHHRHQVDVRAPQTSEEITRSMPVKQLGFNCPSCFTVLIIKDPQNYDGRPAPCPYCTVVIIPPRIAPAATFSIVAASGQTPASQMSRSRWCPFDKRTPENQRLVPNRRIVEAVA